MPNQSWYAINNKAETPDVAEVLIYDEIGAWGVDAKSFATDFRAITAGTINVRLNTPGGSVFDGTAIHNAIKSHPAQVVMHVEGVAASAGSFIMLAGDEIRMADNAYVMIHNSSGGVGGGAKEMRGYAELLDKIDGNIAMMYSAKTGKGADHYRELMDAETWFTAEEAKSEGLVDTVYTAKPAKAAAPAKAASYSTIYNKIPDGVRRMWGLETIHPAPEAPPSGEPAPAPFQKETTMPSDNLTPAAPAPVAVAPAVPTPAPAPAAAAPAAPAPATDAHAAELTNLNKQTVQAFVNNARTVGQQEGNEAAVERAKAIYAVCPDNAKMAIEAFIAGQQPAEVKRTYDAVASERLAAQKASEERERELARLRAELAQVGHPGVGMLPLDLVDVGNEPRLDPKAQAEREWDLKPSVREGFSSRENYVNFRKMEIEGRIQFAR